MEAVALTCLWFDVKIRFMSLKCEFPKRSFSETVKNNWNFGECTPVIPNQKEGTIGIYSKLDLVLFIPSLDRTLILLDEVAYLLELIFNSSNVLSLLFPDL